jgi:hypothetical protein
MDAMDFAVLFLVGALFFLVFSLLFLLSPARGRGWMRGPRTPSHPLT